MTIIENFEHFQHFNFETNFLKKQTLFKKVESRFSIQSIKIDNATFPYKTALSEANLKANRMGSTKWTYHKEILSFPVITFFFRKFCFSLKVVSSTFLLIFLVCLRKSACETKKYVFYFTSKVFSVLEIIKILSFQVFKCHDVIKYLSMKHETHYTK